MRWKPDLAKAEAAVRRSPEGLHAWLGESIARLEAAREAMRSRHVGPDTVGQLYMRVHDLKALGPLCGSPIVGQLAAGVCALFDDSQHLPAAQMGLVDDHLDAIHAVFAAGIASEADPRGARILQDLEREVRER